LTTLRSSELRDFYEENIPITGIFHSS